MAREKEGRGSGQKIPSGGPARETIREWVSAFAYGAGYLLLEVLRRFVAGLDPLAELPEGASPRVERSGLSPITLYRWEKVWTQGGFEALKPQPRQEKSVARTVSTETLDRAEALKREQTFRSVRAIINALQLDRANPSPEAKLSERTLRRHLAKRGATSAQLVAEQATLVA
jgi:hypothetical protein